MDSPVTAKYRLCIYMLEEMVFKKKTCGDIASGILH